MGGAQGVVSLHLSSARQPRRRLGNWNDLQLLQGSRRAALAGAQDALGEGLGALRLQADKKKKHATTLRGAASWRRMAAGDMSGGSRRAGMVLARGGGIAHVHGRVAGEPEVRARACRNKPIATTLP